MLHSGIRIRPASAPDVGAVTRIYAHYVEHTAVTFDVEPPGEGEVGERLTAITGRRLPFLVADADGEILGYSCCTPYRPRPAYRFSVEESVYVAPHTRGHGIGRQLLAGVLAASAAAGMRVMVGVIVDSGDPASLRLHERCGFSVAGRLTAIGFKHGRWLDTILVQRALAPPDR